MVNMEEDIGKNNKSEKTTAEEKWLKQHQERQEYMTKLKQWLDDARLWHYNLCARNPANNIPSSNQNIADSILRQYASLSQTNLLHQHFRNILLNNYTNNVNSNVQTPVFNRSE